jgi:anaerobic magnesium-protoporphyrin IX monomethyl ester cyclase
MKILLVYCNSMLENALPISISQLSACLKEAGITVDLFDTTFYKYAAKSSTERRIEALHIRPCPLNYRDWNMEEDFCRKITDFQPDLVGFSVVEPTFRLALRLLESARNIIEENHIPVAIGGIHAILAPETITGVDLIDYICISEGESALVDLCKKIANRQEITEINGFWVRKGDRWIKNPKVPLTDINSLPIMDFTIFGDHYLYKPMMGELYCTVSVETTRGCPYRCAYCGDQALRKLFKDMGAWYRQKTIIKIEEELKSYIAKYSPEFIYIISESFLAESLKRVKSFTDMYEQFSIPFWFNTRPEDITEDKIKLIKDVGCKRISIGLENANESFRKKYLHRNYSNKTFKRACYILKDYDISFSVSIIMGFPFETREIILESIEVLKDIKPDGVSTHIFNPYHGTESRCICIEHGMISADTIAEDFYQGEYFLKNNTISKEEILGLFRTIPLYIEMDQKDYGRIRIAEKLDDEGNRYFEELKKEYYAIKGW